MARVARSPLAEAAADSRDRMSAMAAVSSRFAGWRPAAEVLVKARGVPTIFPWVNRATRVLGWPTDRPSLIHGPSNHGKAQPIDEPVLVDRGWMEIGKLRIGDEVVGSDGLPHRVVGVFPQGQKAVYEIVFDDGCSTRACAEHLWLTTTERELNRGRYVRGPRPERKRIPRSVGAGSAKSTAHIAATIGEDHYVDFIRPVEWPHRDLPLDPYVLGLLLGDGCFVQSSLSFSKDDLELHEAIGREAARLGDKLTDVTYEGCRTSLIVGDRRPAMRGILANIGLLGKRSEEKFVPEGFLYAGVEQRLALLQGLMDTDGGTDTGTQAQFSTTSPMLRDAVEHLARSLGGRAYTYPKPPSDNLPSWCVMVSGIRAPFRLRRKADAWKPRQKQLRRRIVAVRPVGVSECVCIAVDAPDRLYVTKDFALTHNTEFVLGLGASFLARDHFFSLVDAEYTTPIDWVEELMGNGPDGRPLVRHPGFCALRPRTYEETVDAVRRWAEAIGDARERGEIPRDTTGLVAIDSIRKLVPKKLLNTLLREGADGDEKQVAGRKKRPGGVDGMSGRAAMYKAALNSQWMDELVPLMAHTGTAIAIITREIENDDDSVFAEDFKLTGGRSLFFDSSIVTRVLLEGQIWEGEGKGRRTLGERHRVEVRKTKVGGKEEKVPKAWFHTSNGTSSPAGFDRARDLLDVAVDLGVVTLRGSNHVFEGERVGNGKEATLGSIRGSARLSVRLDRVVDDAVRAETASYRSSNGPASSEP